MFSFSYDLARHSSRSSTQIIAHCVTGHYGTVTTAMVAATADTPVNLNHTAKTAVTGGVKTQLTLLSALLRPSGIMAMIDSFYRGLTTEEAQRVHEHNFDHPDAFDSEQLVECIEKLKSVQSVQVPIYDFKTITGVQTISSSEEKQLFPGSFKICDLNLMEDSEVNENVDCVRDPILFFPSIPESKKKATPADVDLSISNNGNIYLVNMDHSADGKEVEVIDLESDSLQADLAFNNSDRKIPMSCDVQDGYGLMISALIGTEISNCSSVPADISSLHNEMTLNNGEEILGNDESIYMSLGEISIRGLAHAREESAKLAELLKHKVWRAPEKHSSVKKKIAMADTKKKKRASIY
ncbi:hypothetical protein TEA_012391 [Camellia sinensis var. sinensis]|uniref:Phosphoribulokinase/uridine kinase domain-containing protein n=1 Tax=Camellia sinensis var. sinensis TaxID=542762 RepID=A0A4S4DC43_CAMSN|nr:hypothetical protein TEA_012391 [Camellia sinensis var. sinensis]